MVINTNVATNINNRSADRNNRSRSLRDAANGRNNFSQQRNPRFQNSNFLLLILQLIVRLIKQLQANQDKPQDPPQDPPTPKEEVLDLSAKQRQGIQNHFGIFGEQNFSVIDKDRNRRLSVGDVVTVSGGVTGGNIREITLTQADVDAVNGKDLADAQAAFLEHKQKWQNTRPDNYSYTLERSGFIGSEARKPVDITVKGNTVTDARFADGSKAIVPDFNQLSVDSLFNTIERAINSGAAEVRVGYDPQTGVPKSIFIDQDRRLADEEVFLKTSNFKPLDSNTSPSTLPLSDVQKAKLLSLFGVQPGPDAGVTLLDEDGDGKISIGDTAILSGGGFPGGEIERKTLSVEDINALNLSNEFPQELNLSQRQHDAISHQFDDTTPLAFDGQATQYTGTAIDKDGDNKLSVGDIVKLRMYGGFRPVGTPDVFSDHALTAAEVKAINEFSNKDLVPLSTEDKFNLQRAVIRQDVGYIPGDEPRLNSVIDNDNNGKLSVGDSIKIVDTRGAESGNPTFTTRFENLTQAQLDRYNAGVNYNPSSTIDLTANQTKALQELFNLTPGLSSFTILDSNGDNKLSVGDQLEFHRGDDPFPGTPPSSHLLTTEDVMIINSNQSQNELKLTQRQRTAIANRFDRTPPPNTADGFTTRFTGTVIDNNNDGKLSVGDVVKLRDTGGIAGIDRIRDHILTTEDIASINAEPNADVVKGGGVSVGGTLGGKPISNDRVVDINRQRYSVGFLKKQVQNYANSTYVPKGAVDTAFGIHKWGTSNSIAAGRAFERYIADTFPQGEPGLSNPKLLNLTQEQQEAIGARFNRKPPPNLIDASTTQYTGIAIDKDGNGKLSEGDVVKLRDIGGFRPPGNQDTTRDHVLTAADIAYIEADRSHPLLDISKGLSDEQEERLNTAISNFSSNNTSQITGMFDSNSDGKLSVGDSVQFTFQSGNAIGLGFHTITQEELDRYLNATDSVGQLLKLSAVQKAKTESVFNIRNVEVRDNNGDGKISEGDTVTGTLFRETGTINTTYQVSKDNANHINRKYGNELRLPGGQQAALNTELKLNNDLEGIRGVLDRDGNGKLSAGDVIYTRSNLATTGGDPIGGSPKYYHLTAENIKNINSQSN